MKMRNVRTSLLGLSLAAFMAVPALADNINARLKSVDTTDHTFTVVERKVDYTFTVNDTTKFINAKGDPLAEGIKSGDLRPGARLAITYAKEGDKSVASEVKIRAPRVPHTQAPAAPAPPAPAK